MKPNLRNLMACLAMVGLHALAAAEVPAATAEALMRKSGVWAQLGDVATPVKAGLVQSATGGALSPEESHRLDLVADAAFAPDRLREAVMQVLSRSATVAHSADALKWYDSATGRQITAQEEAFSTHFTDMDQVIADGNKALAQASVKRQSLLSQTVQASRMAESMATLQINTTVAVMQGLANAVPNSAMPPAAQMRKALEAQRPHMVAASVGLALSMSALTYQSVSDNALAQYVKFLTSKSGVALTAAMEEALDASLSQAAQRLGSGIPVAPGTTSL